MDATRDIVRSLMVSPPPVTVLIFQVRRQPNGASLK